MTPEKSTPPDGAHDSDLLSAKAAEHDKGPLERDRSIADSIMNDIQPSTVLDVDCGTGLLVQALRQKGAEAFGLVGLEHASQDVSPDVLPYCQRGSATAPFPQMYDLIICIRGLQNLTDSDAAQAIERFCRHTDDILFGFMKGAAFEDAGRFIVDRLRGNVK